MQSHDYTAGGRGRAKNPSKASEQTYPNPAHSGQRTQRNNSN